MIKPCHAEYFTELHAFPLYPVNLQHSCSRHVFQLEWKTEKSVNPGQMASSEAS